MNERQNAHVSVWESICQADNLFRPFALLCFSTFLPPLLLILARKPCTRDLFTLLGWNVRFIHKTLFRG